MTLGVIGYLPWVEMILILVRDVLQTFSQIILKLKIEKIILCCPELESNRGSSAPACSSTLDQSTTTAP